MKQSLKSSFIALSIVTACALPVQAANYFTDNQTIDNVVNPGRVQDKGDVEVLEFFWYGCPHCAAFEPSVQKWVAQLPGNVKFVRMPASWSPSMTNEQRLYYSLEALNRLNLHQKVFNDIHKKHVSMDTPAQISKWAVKQGISATTWNATFNSQSVSDKVNVAQAAYKRFQFNWVPVIVINGKRVVAFTPNILIDAQNAVQEELRALDAVKK